MKVVFINISDIKGGASIAANRLRESLTKNYSVDSYYMVPDKNLVDKRVFATRNKIAGFIEKIIDRIFNKIGLQYQFFPFSSAFLIRMIRQLKPDIISLHNTHGGYFQTTILSKLSQIAPIVWTLHDMWSFTGNAAHTFENESWKELKNDAQLTQIHPRIGINSGVYLLKQKLNIYKKSNVRFVTPSQWLFNLTQQSPVFKGKEIVQIFNGIDLTVFKPLDKAKIRLTLGISLDAKVLMFSAGDLINNMWKGGNHLIEVLKNINSIVNFKVHLIVVGSGELELMPKLPNLIIHQIGFVDNEYQMANYFSACDLFIYPTKADTLSTVLIEAIACGAPCVTFNIGGCSEIVINNYNGIIVTPFLLEEMSISIVELLKDQKKINLMSCNARYHAEKNFSIEQMSKNYYDKFKSIIEQRSSFMS